MSLGLMTTVSTIINPEFTAGFHNIYLHIGEQISFHRFLRTILNWKTAEIYIMGGDIVEKPCITIYSKYPP